MGILELLIVVLIPVVFILIITALIRARIWRTAWYAIRHAEGPISQARNLLIVLICLFLVFAPFVLYCAHIYRMLA